MSSNDIAIRVSGLSKCYHIYDKPRERLLQMLYRGKKLFYREFWALKDVSFEIKRGETIGIIGRNGSGKSTLLQLLCGTLTPTNGTIEINGRVAALLELGAGFNPEFTGRENVFLNASLYGLSRKEIEHRFDQIAAYADIGHFIDQPVRMYSSGMFVRLAFAVQVNINPQIFIIDEALAVGDHRFVQKCYRTFHKMKDEGCNLFFVSHDTTAVKLLSDRAIWLEKGSISAIGDASDVVDAYRNWCDGIDSSAVITSDRQKGGISPGAATGSILVQKMLLLNNADESTSVVKQGEKVAFNLEFKNITITPGLSLLFGFSVRNNRAVEICGANTMDKAFEFISPPAGQIFGLKATFTIPLLAGGDYFISFNLDSKRENGEYITEIVIPDALIFNVTEIVKVYTFIGIEVDYTVTYQETQAAK